MTLFELAQRFVGEVKEVPGAASTNSRPRYLYYLVDPRSYRVRYVGVTYDPKRRRLEHLKPVGGSHRDKWLRTLLRAGVEPVFAVKALLQDAVEAFRTEVKAIEVLKRNGYDLVNGTIGGEGLLLTGEALERRRRAALVNLVAARAAQTPEAVATRNRKIAANRVLTEEGREKIRAAARRSRIGRPPWNKGVTGYRCRRTARAKEPR